MLENAHGGPLDHTDWHPAAGGLVKVQECQWQT